MVSGSTKRRLRCQDEECAKRRKVLLRKKRLAETRNASSACLLPPRDWTRRRKEGADAGSLPQGACAWNLVSAFCARDRKRRTMVSLPGVDIDRVAANLDTCLGDGGTKPIVILRAVRNDLYKVE